MFPATAPATGARHRRGIYHSIELSKGYQVVYLTYCGSRSGRRHPRVSRRATRYPSQGGTGRSYPRLFGELPYLFWRVTLYLTTFFTTAPATGRPHGRDIYHLIEKKKSYRSVYVVGACGPRGGRGGDVCAQVDFEIENAVICTDIVLVIFQVAGLFGRLFCFLPDPGESSIIR